MLRAAPALALAVFLVPLVVGLAGTLLPAFAVLPAIGATEPSLEPWRTLLAWPGLPGSLRATVISGTLASVLSLLLAAALVLVLAGTRWFWRLQAATAPLLAAPHAAIAIGVAAVIAPSGWIVRLLSPELTGWTRPPFDLVTVRDPYGLAVVAGLLVKEVPFLVVMLLAALGQVPAEATLRAARAMGYHRTTAWLKLVFPVLWPQVRLPFYAVVAYSYSVVDQAVVLGPGTPPTLAVLATRWFADADIAQQLPAAAAATLQLLLVLLALGVCWLAEVAVRHFGPAWLARGKRSGAAEIAAPVGTALGVLALLLGFAALLSLVAWSFAERWPFGTALPVAWSAAGWTAAADRLAATAGTTALVGTVATALALLLCLLCLENDDRRGRRGAAPWLWLVYLPLLLPQVSFLFGVQVALVRAGLDGTLAAVVWSHLVFVLPYVFLALSDPWRALDPRLARAAATLGAAPGRVFLQVKLPALLRPVLAATAVGFGVSVGQYLPTVFAGAGRVATVTTDAIAIAGGADRRAIAVYGFLQAALPLAGYALALWLPRLAFRNRRGLS